MELAELEEGRVRRQVVLIVVEKEASKEEGGGVGGGVTEGGENGAWVWLFCGRGKDTWGFFICFGRWREGSFSCGDADSK